MSRSVDACKVLKGSRSYACESREEKEELCQAKQKLERSASAWSLPASFHQLTSFLATK